MADFRKKYLVNKGQRKLLFSAQLKRISCRCYIVGSDQIWNPDITCGLRRVYFGAFESPGKEKVIAYAASLGGASLVPGYDKRFSELVRHVDAVSLREKEAIPYVRRFYPGDITAVLDPVFLLTKWDWREIEKQPGADKYILVYATEKNDEMINYVRKLSREKELTVIELRTNRGEKTGFLTDYTAGPAEFLGYIHKAYYVVTNSFHAVAFSIIYEKNFVVFQHSERGTRIQNILQIYELEDRIYKEGRAVDIDRHVDWDSVRYRMRERVRLSEDFLKENIMKK